MYPRFIKFLDEKGDTQIVNAAQISRIVSDKSKPGVCVIILIDSMTMLAQQSIDALFSQLDTPSRY